MADANQAPRDGNYVPSMLFMGSDGLTYPVEGDEATGRLYVDLPGGSGTVTSVSVVSANGFAGTVATATTTPAITLSTTITGILEGNGTAISAASTTGSGAVVLATSPTLVTPILGTPTSGTLTNTTGFPVANLAGAGAGVLTFLATPSSANLISALTDETGTGVAVFNNSPTFADDITIGVAGSATGSILMKGTTSGTVTIKTADAAGTWTFTLPENDGDAGQVLSTNGSGVTSWIAAGGVPTTITVADEAADTTCFIGFFTAATGDLGPKTNTNLTFNSLTGVLTSASAVLTTADINGGTVDNATIGATTASTIVGTTITANTGFMPDADDGAYLGQSGTAFADLFLASGGIINWNAGNVTLTHSAGILTQNAGELRITSANVGTNADSVPTLSSTSTLTNKTLTSPSINTATLGGHQTMSENAAFLADPVLSADGKYNGWVRGGTAGAALAFGDLCYLDPTDSRWELCDANAASAADGDSRGTLGICVLAAAADGDPTVMLRWGWVRADTAFPAMTINAPMYVSETAGDITGTQPTTTDVVIRIIGAAETADELFFNPDQTWITHT